MGDTHGADWIETLLAARFPITSDSKYSVPCDEHSWFCYCFDTVVGRSMNIGRVSIP